MSFPICDECTSGQLCEKCEWKVREGEVSELDILVSTILAEHDAKGYARLVDLGDKLVIFASVEEAPLIIGFKGMIVKELSRKLGRRIVVLVKGWDAELIAKSLGRPSQLLGVNKIYKEGGVEILKLIFDKHLDEGSVLLLKELLGEVEIEYKAFQKNYKTSK